MTAGRLLAALSGLGLVACETTETPRAHFTSATWSVPAPGLDCLELSASRVCYESSIDCPEPPCVTDRPSPGVPALSPLGFRCTGEGKNRRCVDRARLTDRFTCDRAHCMQRHPRLPDDGEWTCADQSGAVLCVGGVRAAGVAHPVAASGWHCGERNGTDERVCVDFDPDFPDGNVSGWRCRFAHEAGTQRLCDRARPPATLDIPCSMDTPCVDGAICAGGHCIPLRPQPACWLDTDCASGVCRFGSCVKRP